jgi:hypothetical protein
MTEIPKHRALLPTLLSLVVLALAFSLLTCCLPIRGSNRPGNRSCWVELRESAVKNKQKLARLLLTDPIPVAKARNGSFGDF